MRLYVDSNVFISLFKEEIGKNLRSLYAEALSFFENAGKSKHILILSNLTIKEITKVCFIDEPNIIEELKKYSIKVVIVEINKEKEKSYYYKGVHYPDSLHASTAKKELCDGIVTFNTKDFQIIKEEIQIFQPSDITESSIKNDSFLS